jgi:poly(A) polymerase
VVFDTTILGSNPSAPAKLMNKVLNSISVIRKVKNLLFPFYNSPEIKKIFQILEKDQPKNKKVAMFVGGCVRKYILQEEIDDIDIATIFNPEEIKKKFKNTGAKIIETGIEHGSVVLIFNNQKFEITTLRKDEKTDGRHAEVSFTDDWQLDSERRDFTFNSIYLSRKGKIYDPQLGVNDLKRGVVKFIGDPNKRIEEDYLRIIRFIRFALQYDYKDFENSTLEAIKLNLNGIKNLSKERILSELFKILNLKSFRKITENEELKNIFSLIFPELKYLTRLKKFQYFPEDYKIGKSLLLSILIIDDSNNFEYFCHKYKVSNELKNKLYKLNDLLNKFEKNKQFLKKDLIKNSYYSGKNNLTELNKFIFFLDKNMKLKNFLEIEQNIKKILIPKFPFDGKFLISKGFSEGKKMGKVIKKIEEEWVDRGYHLPDSDLQEILNKNNN